MPRPLPDELLEEVLRRLPPDEPAELVRAALVSRRWRRLVSDTGFRRRFREFHRHPPMLGMLCNHDIVARFVPTAAFSPLEAGRGHWRTLDARGHWRALDARHGRVLLLGNGDGLVVWDPITDEEQVLPSLPCHVSTSFWTAAVLCAAADACDHLDCHRGPFVVVFVSSTYLGRPDAEEIFLCTYTSETAAWTKPICTRQPGYSVTSRASALGTALYFMDFWGSMVLKYNLESQEISWILLPPSLHPGQHSLLTATENGELVLATVHRSKLYIWLRDQDACKLGDKWKPRKAIKLKKLLPADAALSKLHVVGSAEGVGIIFIRTDDVFYTIDLKTYKTKKVCEGKINNIVPYMSFYTPGLGAAVSMDEGPGSGASNE